MGQLSGVLGRSRVAPSGARSGRSTCCRRAGDELEPAGRPLYGGLLACAVPDSPVGATWRHADRLREYRGDSHVNAWTAAAFDAVEIGLLSDLWLGRQSPVVRQVAGLEPGRARRRRGAAGRA